MNASEIARILSRDIEGVVAHLTPHGKREGSYINLGDDSGASGKSLRINLTGELAGRWRDYSTGDSGDLIDLWARIRGLDLRAAIYEAARYANVEVTGGETVNPIKRSVIEKKERTFEEPTFHTQPTEVKNNPEVQEYLNGRGITDDTLETYRVKAGPGTIAFMYYDRDDRLTMAKAMKIVRDESGRKVMRLTSPGQKPILFGWQAIPRNAREITITEGEIDAMTLHQYGYPALSVPMGGGSGNKHSWIEHEYENLSQFDRIYLALDMDDAGNEAVTEISKRLKGLKRTRLLRVELPFKDANECMSKGVFQQEINECYANAGSFDPPQIRTALDYMDSVLRILAGDAGTDGDPFPWPFLSDKLRMRPGEVTVWTGINGHGKSLMLSQVLAHLAARGVVSCNASLEMPADRTIARMTQQAAGCKPSEEYARYIAKWLSERAILYVPKVEDRVTLEDLLDGFEYVAGRFGATHFVIDSLMMLPVKHDDFSGQNEVMRKLNLFAQHHEVHVHLVVHPRKGQDEDGMPTKMDVGGSGALTNLACNVVCVHRNKRKEKLILKDVMELSEKDHADLKKGDLFFACYKQRNGEWEGLLHLDINRPSLQCVQRGHKPIQYVGWSKHEQGKETESNITVLHPRRDDD